MNRQTSRPNIEHIISATAGDCCIDKLQICQFDKVAELCQTKG